MFQIITDYLISKKIRITKENLYEQKKKFIDYITDEHEFSDEYRENIIRDNKSLFFLYSFNTCLPLNDDVCGICIVREIKRDKISKTYVLSFYAIIDLLRGNGYGVIMFEELIKYLLGNSNKKVIIYTHSLEDSIEFYKRLGFQITDYICDYMYDLEEIDEEADVMMKYVCEQK